MSKNKQPTHKFNPPSLKKPAVVKDVDAVAQRKLQFVFSTFDADWPWCRDRIASHVDWRSVLSKMDEYQTRTWGEIEQNRKRDHAVSIDKLIKDAKKRLSDLEIELDALWRFRFTGTQRLWGIRDQNKFNVLWFDPCHEICPWEPSNT